jgi:hypothetical protein
MNKIQAIIMLLFGLLLLFGCASKINLLPMYGRTPKSPRLINADMKFVKAAIEEHGSADSASRYYVGVAWQYLYRNDISTAMKRFNQAWLLDSLNSDVYWGFGATIGYRNGDVDSALSFLTYAAALKNEPNERLSSNIAFAYGQKAIKLRSLFNLKTIDTPIWQNYYDSSMSIFRNLSCYSRENCFAVLQWWQIATEFEDRPMMARAKTIADSVGVLPFWQQWYDGLSEYYNRETVKE